MGKIKRYIIILFLLFVSGCLFSQEVRPSEKKIRERADKLFDEKNYDNAFPLFSQLLSLYPKHPDINYKFGVCLLYSDSKDSEKPIPYLLYASRYPDKVSPELLYYLGKAYHLNYRFSDAIKYYTKFRNIADSKTKEKYDVDREIAMCRNGMQMISSANELFVISKKQVDKKDFYLTYDLTDFGGVILLKPDSFKSSLDKVRGDKGFIYFSRANNTICYSSYGQTGNTGKDIYFVRKNQNGTWTKPERLSDVINGPFDEEYPVLSVDKKTLYFASKGFNSMGGYDIFKSNYNTSSNTWSVPENLNFPINTPYSDFMFVPDKNEKYAYFTSTRNSEFGKYNVFKVRIDKNKAQPKNLLVEVKDTSDNGKNDTAYLASIKRIKESANLAVNSNEVAEKNNPAKNSNNTNAQNTQIKTQTDSISPFLSDNITNQEIQALAIREANIAEEAVKVLNEKIEAAKLVAEERHLTLKNKNREIQQKTNKVAFITDNKEKEKEILEINKLKAETDSLQKEASVADTINKQYENELYYRKKEADDAKNFADEINKAIKDDNNSKPVAIINQHKRTKTKSYKSKSKTPELVLNDKEKKYVQKKNELTRYKEKQYAVNSQADSLITGAKKLKEKAKRAKNKTERADLLKQAQQMEMAASEKKIQAAQIAQNNEKNQKEVEKLKADAFPSTTAFNSPTTVKTDKQEKATAKDNKTIAQVNSSKTQVKSIEKTQEPKPVTKNESHSDTINKPSDKTPFTDIKDDKTIAQVNSSKIQDKSLEKSQEPKPVTKNESHSDTINKPSDKTPVTEIKDDKTKQIVKSVETPFVLPSSEIPAFSNAKNIDYINDDIAKETQKTELISKNQELVQKEIYQLQQMQKYAVSSQLKEDYNKKIIELNKTLNSQKELADNSQKQIKLLKKNNITSRKENSDKIQQNQNTDDKYLAKSLYKESAIYLEQASKLAKDTLKSENIENKRKNTKEIIQLIIKSKEKEIEALEVLGIVNENNYISNNIELNNNKGIIIPSSANSLKDSANILFDKAQSIKALASSAERPEEKINLLNDATKLENKAIEDQIKVKNIIAGAPKPIVVATIDKPKENTRDIKAQQIVPETKPTSSNNLKSSDNKANAIIKQEPVKENKPVVSKQTEPEKKQTVVTKKPEPQTKQPDIAKQAEPEKKQTIITKQPEIQTKQPEIAKQAEPEKKQTIITKQPEIQTKQPEIAKQVEPEKKQAIVTKQPETQTKQPEIDKQAEPKKEQTVITKQPEVLTKQPEIAKQTVQNKEQLTNTQNNKTVQSTKTVKYISLDFESSDNKAVVDNPEKLKVRANIYKRASQNANTEADSLKASLPNIKDEKTRDSYNQKISELETIAKENDDLAKTTLKNAGSSSKDKNSEQNKKRKKKNKFNPVIEPYKPDSTTTETQYSAGLMDEANNYRKEAVNLKEISKNKRKKVRERSNAKAEEMLKTADKLELEATEINTIANQNKYIANNTKTVALKSDDINTDDIKKVNSLAEESQKEYSKSVEVINEANKLTDPVEKKKKLIEANTLQASALTKQEQAFELYFKFREIKVQTEKELLARQQKEMNQTPVAIVNNKVVHGIAFEENTNNLNNTTSKEAFSNQPVLIEQHLDLPEGLFFKVQVGAFRKPIPQKLFAGMRPVVGEKTNLGFTRYTAGMFTSFEDADLAKNKIRSMNYKDAFVVAYLNGRRININEARQMAENNPQLAQRAELAVSNNIKNNISQPEQIQPVKVMKNLPIENSAYKEIIPPDGFYYTVQVGVFKRKIRPEEHYNLDSLHYKNMPNGNLRYYSGIFFRGRTALSARQRIINKGVKGAFVVAFNNGNQINLDDALRLEQPTNQLAPAQQQIVKTEPTVKKMKTEEVNNLVNISNTAKLNIPEGKIIYKIQIGAYKNEVPVEVVNLMLKIVNKGIEQSKSNDMTIYLAGTFEDYKSANDFRQMVNKEGIPDAFVVAFNGQHKITVTDAMKAKGE